MSDPTPTTILRVFPRRTKQTPDDALAFIGHPGLFLPKRDTFREIHVSVAFTWDINDAQEMAKAWQAVFPGAPLKIDGPAFGHAGNGFVPGLYLKKGNTMTSRGCPGVCEHCLVPQREGPIRELDPVPPGHNVQDNNLLACSRKHFLAVMAMLEKQKEAAMFNGGLQADRLSTWHIDQMRRIRIRRLFLAYDRPVQIVAVQTAVRMLAELGLKRSHIGCFVLVGFKNDTPEAAADRAQAAWDAGTLPYLMFYRAPDCRKNGIPQPWHDLVGRWTKGIRP